MCGFRPICAGAGVSSGSAAHRDKRCICKQNGRNLRRKGLLAMKGLRAVAAVFTGVLASVVVVALIESASHAIYPSRMPSSASPEAMGTWVAQLPIGALALVLFAWAIGDLVGILAAQWLWSTGRRAAAFWVGAVMLAAVIANLLMIPSPLWFVVLGIGEILLITGWLARRGAQTIQQASS